MADAGQTTRDRLVHAARDLFTTIGYHATTTPVLARRAGVAEGTIYRHFPSKQALFNAAFQETQHWGVSTIRSVAAGTPRGTADRLGQLGRFWLDRAEHDPPQMRLLLGWQDPAILDEASRAAAAEVRQGLEHLIALGKQEGTVRAGVVELWASVWLALVAFAAEQVARRDWTATHPHALATLEAAWEAIAWRPIAVGAPERPLDASSTENA